MDFSDAINDLDKINAEPEEEIKLFNTQNIEQRLTKNRELFDKNPEQARLLSEIGDDDRIELANAGIYAIICCAENEDKDKIYFGQAIDIGRRLKQHREARTSKDSKWLHKKIKSLGAQNFKYKVVEIAVPDTVITNKAELEIFSSKLDVLEKNYIMEYNSLWVNNSGFNDQVGGQGGARMPFPFDRVGWVQKLLYDEPELSKEAIKEKTGINTRTIGRIERGEGVYRFMCPFGDINHRNPEYEYRPELSKFPLRTEEQNKKNQQRINVKKREDAQYPVWSYDISFKDREQDMMDDIYNEQGKYWPSVIDYLKTTNQYDPNENESKQRGHVSRAFVDDKNGNIRQNRGNKSAYGLMWKRTPPKQK